MIALSGLIGLLSFCVLPDCQDDNAPLVAIPCPDPVIMAIAFSPDCRVIATGGHKDKPTVRLWDVETTRELRAFPNTAGRIFGLAFTPDGKSLITCSFDSRVLLWTIDGTQVGEFPHHATVSQVQISPDGRLLATACGHDDSTIRIWDIESRKLVKELKGHGAGRLGEGVVDVAFSPDGQLLASSGQDGTVRLWNVSSGEQIKIIDRFDNSAGGLEFSPDGSILSATSSLDNLVRLYQLPEGAVRTTLSIRTAGIVKFSTDGRSLYAGSMDDRSIHVFDIASGKEVSVYPGQLPSPLMGLAVSPNGRYIAWSGQADEKGSVRLMRLQTVEQDKSK